MVKKMKVEETPFYKMTKLELFNRDIQEIIEKKIEYCELVDCPYAASTVSQDLEYRARRVCREILSKMDRRPEKVDFFRFAKLIDENKKTHFYAWFNVKAWNELVGE